MTFAHQQGYDTVPEPFYFFDALCRIGAMSADLFKLAGHLLPEAEEPPHLPTAARRWRLERGRDQGTLLFALHRW